MKNGFIASLLLATFLFFCSQTKDNIANIKVRCREIDQKLKTFSKKTKEDNDESTDGGTIAAYYYGKQVQLITTEYLGETGKLKNYYYFDNDMLIYAVTKDFDYNRPYYWDEKMAKKAKDSTSFDYKKTIIKTNKFYFNDDNILKWITAENKEISDTTLESLKFRSDILNEIKRLQQLLRSK
jgi:hypothetical protein